MQAREDLDGFLHRGLDHVHLLEAARQRMVLLEDAAVFLVGGGADAAQLAAGQRRLDEVRGIHDATGGGARADEGVDLVDEQDGARLLLHLGDHGLEALLEIAAILGARQQAAQVEGIDDAIGQRIRHAPLDDEPREALHNGRLADARFADVQRVVLAATAQDLDGALDFDLPAHERIDAPLDGSLVEVDA